MEWAVSSTVRKYFYEATSMGGKGGWGMIDIMGLFKLIYLLLAARRV